jgi:hypothetical protein
MFSDDWWWFSLLSSDSELLIELYSYHWWNIIPTLQSSYHDRDHQTSCYHTLTILQHVAENVLCIRQCLLNMAANICWSLCPYMCDLIILYFLLAPISQKIFTAQNWQLISITKTSHCQLFGYWKILLTSILPALSATISICHSNLYIQHLS